MICVRHRFLQKPTNTNPPPATTWRRKHLPTTWEGKSSSPGIGTGRCPPRSRLLGDGQKLKCSPPMKNLNKEHVTHCTSHAPHHKIFHFTSLSSASPSGRFARLSFPIARDKCLKNMHLLKRNTKLKRIQEPATTITNKTSYSFGTTKAHNKFLITTSMRNLNSSQSIKCKPSLTSHATQNDSWEGLRSNTHQLTGTCRATHRTTLESARWNPDTWNESLLTTKESTRNSPWYIYPAQSYNSLLGVCLLYWNEGPLPWE